MHPHEIVVRKMQCDRRLQVFKLLAESVRDGRCVGLELSKIVHAAYAPIFKLNLEAASPAQFVEQFRATYPGTEDVSRRSQTFFLNAAREAGIKISAFIMRNKKPRSTAAKKRVAKVDANSGGG